MAAKRILVFESDQSFGAQLAADFARFGARVEVVDDGNAGLERARLDRPDLILLSIELPRMNGFSICNKLKKNPELKDIPLIIMSSEATEETFEQHRKLRTRAEDYLRKPFDFEGLLERVQRFVTLELDPNASDEPVVFDEEIAIDDSIAFEDETVIGGAMGTGGPGSRAPERVVDDEVEAFAEEAFGNLMMNDPDRTLTGEPTTSRKRSKSKPTLPVAEPVARVVPPEPETDPEPESVSEQDQELQTDLRTPPTDMGTAPRGDDGDDAAWRAQAEELEQQVQRLSSEVQRLTDELTAAGAQAQQARQEAVTAKADAAKVGRQGGVSSREFLDLRETINKKDKEILDLRDAINARDKQIFEVRDRVNGLEREKADLDDRQIAVEKELADHVEQIEGLQADKEATTKRADDLKQRLERAQGEIEKAYRDLDGEKRRRDEVLAAKDREMVELREEQRLQIEQLTAQRDQREAAAVSAMEQGVRREMQDALAKQKGESDASIEVLKSEHEKALEEAEERKSTALFEAEERRKTDLRLADDQRREELRQAEARHEQALKTTREELAAEREREISNQIERHGRDMAVLGGKLAEAEDKAQRRSEELSALRADKEKNDAVNADRIGFLTKRGDDLEGERDSLRVELSTARAEIEVMTGKVKDLADRLADLDAKNAANEERALRALTKIRADEQTLDKAKRAMAIALSLLDEHIQPHAEAAEGGSASS